jgi:release factor glutamine methyltransferase
MEIRPIGRFQSPMKSKFGIPRQSGLVSELTGRIVFEPAYRRMEAIRGLEDFDYLWLIWEFSANTPSTNLTVRPPRLGGNKRMGVFATRSPFRPNNLGLSCVRIDRIEEDKKWGPVIHVKGADLMDGTPIYDIKPYVTYADSHPEARSGFVDQSAWQELEVVMPDAVAALFIGEELTSLREVLALDPRPHYQEDPERVYGMPYGGYDIRFKVEGTVLTVVGAQENRLDYEYLWRRLAVTYAAGEAKALVRWVLDVRFGLSMADILCGKLGELSADDQAELESIMQRLDKGEPVQYIIGVADFCGRQFHVAPGVLIPRPETEELCQWIIASDRHGLSRTNSSEVRVSPCQSDATILDIGTGSGCIAITLALEMPEAKVTAWDISDDALRIARQNAEALGADVTFEHQDILNPPPSTLHLPPSTKYDLIVSNPPYICDKEKAEMEPNVLDYEPSQALFVPDDDPLLFYRAIARYAIEALKPHGCLYFEINPLYADDLASLLGIMSCHDIEIKEDQYGMRRFLKAKKI